MDILVAVAKAMRSLLAPGMFAVFISTVLVTILILFGLIGGISAIAVYFATALHSSWAQILLVSGTSAVAAIMAWLLFPGIMPLTVSFFGNRIADAIEKEDYANRPPAKPASLWPEILHDAGFGLRAIFLNIICLPLYLVPVVNIFLFYILNGYLLGREFFVMAARRHMSVGQAEALRRRYARPLLISGIFLVFLATIPIVNLIVPFWGVALATHLFHQVYDTETGSRTMIEAAR